MQNFSLLATKLREEKEVTKGAREGLTGPGFSNSETKEEFFYEFEILRMLVEGMHFSMYKKYMST